MREGNIQNEVKLSALLDYKLLLLGKIISNSLLLIPFQYGEIFLYHNLTDMVIFFVGLWITVRVLNEEKWEKNN